MKVKRFVVAVGLGLGLSLALLWVLGGAARALSDATPIHYVAITGTDSGDCSTPAGACRTVQYAVDQAGKGDEVRVATGVYTGVSARDEMTQAVYIVNPVTIRGGYTTTNWNVSNPVSYPTTLDAQGQGRVVAIRPKFSNVTYVIEGLRLINGSTTGSGGGIYAWTHGFVIIRECQISGNTALGPGGGVYLKAYNKTILESNRIFSNTALLSGGGGVSIGFSQNVALVRNKIWNNEAIDGGGVSVYESDAVTLKSNEICGNAVDGRGGGVTLNDSDNATLINNLVTGNQSGNEGGGLYAIASSARLLHNTIARNQAGDGSGVYVRQVQYGQDVYYSTVALINTILVSHTVGITVSAGNTVTLEATLWGSGTWANGTDWGGAGAIFTGTVNVWGDPAFVMPDAGDYHIAEISAAKDTGVNARITRDIDGQFRPYDGGYDIGADEFLPFGRWPSPSKLTPTRYRPGCP